MAREYSGFFEFGGQLWLVGTDGKSAEAIARRADVVQSVVGPPDAAISRGESGRWPDRHALTKVRSMVQDRLWATERYSSLEMPRGRAILHLKEILKYIEELDKGEAVPESQDAMEEG